MVSPKRSLSPEGAQQGANPKRQKVDDVPDDASNDFLNDAQKDSLNDVHNAAQKPVQSPPKPSPEASSGKDEQLLEEVKDLQDTGAVEMDNPTQHSLARNGIQRAIALALEHDGFSSATPQALEGFTFMVENYLESIIEETKRIAASARRDYPVPTDFEAMLRRYNLPISSLKPHLKNPIPQERAAPKYVNLAPLDEDNFTSLPLLGAELSGQADKADKQYIPSSFPEFPSRHTYKFTQQGDSRSRDSQKIREEAARTAQHGEDALRRLVRASKMRKQKEVKSLVERDSQGKERFRLWESTMKRFMGPGGRGEPADQVDIADHSMIVNGDALFSRKEVSKLGKRNATLPHKGA